MSYKKAGGGEARDGAFASVPCGACPHIGLCTPDVISPATYVLISRNGTFRFPLFVVGFQT